MKLYPNLEKFFRINVKKVKELIKPLGLAYRAEGLKKVSDKIRHEFDKKVPNNLKDLKALFAVGDYGANAVLCFGFNKKRPLLDTNFIRIYKRIFNIVSEKKRPKSDKMLWAFSEYLLPEKRYVEFNYGVLDFGGNICTSKKPKCENCLINEICFYYRNLNSEKIQD